MLDARYPTAYSYSVTEILPFIAVLRKILYVVQRFPVFLVRLTVAMSARAPP